MTKSESDMFVAKSPMEVLQVGDVLVGGFNHCSLHCRLAKSRGLMRRGKYGAVIG